MASVFLLHHVHDLDGVDDVKLIGVYSSAANAEAARDRISSQPGFSQRQTGFEVSECEIDRDHWTEGFSTAISIEVPLLGSHETATAIASRVGSGYRLWPVPEGPTEKWRFQPNQVVRCELQKLPDGTSQLLAVELAFERA
jgi:hypothetical protein